MKQYRVVFAPETQEQLATLYHYIAAAASPEIAERYTNAIVSYCEGLRTIPLRGTRRDDIRPGLRITNYKKRAVIAFEVDASIVSIIGVFYGGQDYETVLQSELDEQENITPETRPSGLDSVRFLGALPQPDRRPIRKSARACRHRQTTLPRLAGHAHHGRTAFVAPQHE